MYLEDKMTAPNITGLTSLYGKTSVLQVTSSFQNIVTNAAASNKVLKINALYCSNIHGSASATITVSLYRSGFDYNITNAVVVPINSTLDVISKSIYLEEGDSIRIHANANGYVEAICSYEEIS